MRSFVTSLWTSRKWLRAHQEEAEPELRLAQLWDGCERDGRWAPGALGCACAVDDVCDPLAEGG